MNILFAVLAFAALPARAHLDSTVAGVSIRNTHQVSERLLRGSEPRRKFTELAALGVTDVVIFKNQVRGEVDRAIEEFASVGVRTHHIPFRWKDLESPEIACRQVVQALRIMRDNERAGRTTFFHCTAGEDRTGLLAGLWRVLKEGMEPRTAWTTEMCPRGYADGNPAKPRYVSDAIHAELTPLFFGLAEKARAGVLSLSRLDARACNGFALSPVELRCR